jgi:2-aminoadipate transaminase
MIGHPVCPGWPPRRPRRRWRAATDRQTDWTSLFARRTRAGVGGGLIEILRLADATDVISFAGGFPDPATFPREAVLAGVEELVETGDATPFQYSPTPGLAGPRDFIAARLERLEGRRPEPGELLVTSGAVEALELLGKSLLDPGDLVLVESPTYLGAIMAFRSFEAELLGVPMDEDGLEVDGPHGLEGILRQRRPKLLYTIPDYQNPTGSSLSEARRRRLVELARRHGSLVVEDVAYRELGFEGHQPPSLWSLAPDVVVQVGTFSKTFLPGVRLGWAVGPEAVVAQLTIAKQNTDQCAGALGQRLVEIYGRSGRMDLQILSSRELYRRRRDLLLRALPGHLPAVARWTRPRGGFFVWVTLDADVDTAALMARAQAVGLAYVPGRPFFPDEGGRNTIRLSFSRVDDELIEEGVRRLGRLLGEALRASS